MDELTEAATKKRRGRPTLHTQDYYDNVATLFPNVSKRSLDNLGYVSSGYEIAKDLLGPDKAEMTFSTENGFRMQGVLEQVGRMSEKGYSKQFCMTILDVALRFCQEGEWTSRQAERFVRRTRITGDYTVAATEIMEGE